MLHTRKVLNLLVLLVIHAEGKIVAYREIYGRYKVAKIASNQTNYIRIYQIRISRIPRQLFVNT